VFVFVECARVGGWMDVCMYRCLPTLGTLDEKEKGVRVESDLVLRLYAHTGLYLLTCACAHSCLCLQEYPQIAFVFAVEMRTRMHLRSSSLSKHRVLQRVSSSASRFSCNSHTSLDRATMKIIQNVVTVRVESG
jgi:hypothetical protein